MILRTFAASIALAAVSAPAAVMAQEAAMPVTEVAPATVAQPTLLRLSANTPVSLTLNSALSTKSNLTGEKFSMTVAQDVIADGQIVVPKGTRAIGLITYAKGNGGFGKSGKMELAFKYLEMAGKQIPLEGTYYQEGAGNTAGTIGAVFAAGVIGGMVVKGKSAEMVAGKDFSATIAQDVPFASTAGRIAIDQGYVAPMISMQTETEKERKKRIKAAEKKAKG